MLSKEQKDERSDATADDSSTKAGYIKFYLLILTVVFYQEHIHPPGSRISNR